MSTSDFGVSRADDRGRLGGAALLKEHVALLSEPHRHRHDALLQRGGVAMSLRRRTKAVGTV